MWKTSYIPIYIFTICMEEGREGKINFHEVQKESSNIAALIFLLGMLFLIKCHELKIVVILYFLFW